MNKQILRLSKDLKLDRYIDQKLARQQILNEKIDR